MFKRTVFIGLSIAVILTSGFVSFLAYSKFEDARMAVSKKIHNQAMREAGPEDRVALLVQSNLLAPSQSKVLEIAEAALEADNEELASEYIGKIDSLGVRGELAAFRVFSSGDYDSLNQIPENPVTNIGMLMKSIKSSDYIVAGYESAFIYNIRALCEESCDYREVISISDMFTHYNQPHVSSYILNSLKNEHPCAVSIHSKIAKNYEAIGNYEAALEEVESAIICDLGNKELYEEAISYAQMSGDLSKKDIFEARLRYLKDIES